ncbi:MAG: glycoside hydrolase family 20 zincin-like fold domain-containing protein, partial [Pyrinomonadaceae bacterium]
MLNTLTRSAVSRPLVLLLLVVSSYSVATAQQQPSPDLVRLIPRPRQIALKPDRFLLSSKTRIVLADSHSEDDRFAATDFADDLQETAKLPMKVGGSRARNSILIGSLDLPGVQAALKRLGISVPANLDVEGYVLVVNAKEVLVAGKSAAGTFYGLQTLKQLVRGEGSDAFIPAVEIVDWPVMRWRGVSDDISRGPVPTVSYIKRQLRTFAAFKLNMHSFYMEHTFASSANPLIGPAGGALTPDEIRELVAYARRYHIELVPEQQTFGH